MIACGAILLPRAKAASFAPASLNALLEPIRQANGLPALAAAVVKGGRTIGVGAVGLRKAGGSTPVTTDDKWHIGSCTKSMTAALAGSLVEEGKLRWDMTLAEMFPALAPQILPEWRAVTLEQLVSNHGGAPNDLNKENLWGRLWERVDKPPREQRAYLVREVLTKHKPVAAPGTQYVYSNAGFALIGHAIETRLDRPWEEVLRERLFVPLGMTSAGFGAPASVGQVDHPWGHKVSSDDAMEPIQPGLQADNPAAIGPGGTVHCSIGDFAQYAAWQLAGARGAGRLLTPETFKKLHTPFASGSDYAGGLVATQRSWGGGTVLTHAGSNTMFFAVMWIAPERGFAVVICTNVGGDGAEKAVDEAAATLIREYLGDDPAR